MELRHLRYFVAVAEELHFGRAAQRLHISQPPLSQQIRDLEQELGVQLFNRTRRAVSLTTSGEIFLEEARLTLSQAERAIDRVREAGEGLRGRLDVGFVTSSSYSILPEVIRRYREQFPGVELGLHEMIPTRQREALIRGEIDAGLLRPPVDSTDVRAETVLHEPLVAALPCNHRLAHRKRIPLSLLKDDPFILFPARHGPGVRSVIQAAFRRADIDPPVVYAPNEMQAILAYVAGGLGVSLVPQSLCDFHRDQICYIPLSDRPATQLDLCVVWCQTRANPQIEQFTALCREIGSSWKKTV